jgi:hypothetical protein
MVLVHPRHTAPPPHALRKSPAPPALPAHEGASPSRLVYLLADEGVIPVVTGTEGNTLVNLYRTRRGTLALGLVAATALLVVAFACVAPAPARQLVLYAALVSAAALVSPLSGCTGSQWPCLLNFPGGGRYFFFARVALLLVGVWTIARLRPTPLRTAAMVGAGALFAIGAVASWRYPPFAVLPLAPATAELAAAAPEPWSPCRSIPSAGRCVWWLVASGAVAHRGAGY